MSLPGSMQCQTGIVLDIRVRNSRPETTCHCCKAKTYATLFIE